MSDAAGLDRERRALELLGRLLDLPEDRRRADA